MSADPKVESTRELTQKEKVSRALIMVAGFIALAITAAIGLRQPVEFGEKPSKNSPPPPKSGASPDAFAARTERNPFQPEYRTDRDGDPLARAPDPNEAMDPDGLLREFARKHRDEEALAAAANDGPTTDYPMEPSSMPPPRAARRMIGTIDLTPPEAAGSPKDADAGGGATPGTLIRAALMHAVSSDYPGAPWMAIVTADAVLPTGETVVSAGETIMGTIGRHDGPNAVLQSRLPLLVAQVIAVDGRARPVRAAVLDSSGIAAIPGKTNRHITAQAGGVAAAAVLGASAASATTTDSFSTQSAFSAQAAQGAAQQVTPAVTKYLNVQPTVTLAAGTSITLVLTESVTP